MKPVVVYVHGAFISDSTWWWSFVAEKLRAHGIESRAVDLPSCGPAGPLGTLADDVDAVRKVIAEVDTPVILVGHSYGGAVISAAAVDQPSVRHLVYISAVVPEGTSVVDCGFIPEDQVPELDIREDGTVSEGPQHFKSRVLESLPTPEMTEEAVSRLTRQSVASFTDIASGEAWRTVASSYIITQFDADVPVSAQRAHAARTGTVHEVPTNHFAHLERPDLVAEILLGIAAADTEATAAEATSA
ncbi:pimeloyl-ACP methyl ester carboxylesterase [Nocardia tenerifensis]|uniref:Pimeloyl-ACP methyl ester carboxylesterase n=1 Tax=Nocardia tenerifensis TaxID=228006 RepID=A0A318JNB1_9NOCA|nr:alpha/beta hydrolase [Nocardia tenerifensis]PXX54886.1 pimeloyl-ACP methyl ester carboxylesterase [Nocardia tenerifensis]